MSAEGVPSTLLIPSLRGGQSKTLPSDTTWPGSRRVSFEDFSPWYGIQLHSTWQRYEVYLSTMHGWMRLGNINKTNLALENVRRLSSVWLMWKRWLGLVVSSRVKYLEIDETPDGIPKKSYNNSSTLTSVVARPVNYCNTRRSMFDMTITHEYMPPLGTSRDPANCESKCVRSGELLKSGATQLNAYSNTWRTTRNHWSIGNLTIPYLWPM